MIDIGTITKAHSLGMNILPGNQRRSCGFFFLTKPLYQTFHLFCQMITFMILDMKSRNIIKETAYIFYRGVLGLSEEYSPVINY